MRFVVHLHDATTLHFDLRLEAEDGRLKSWAVPRGPSLDPSVRRLAVRTPDHDLDYAGFEGLVDNHGRLQPVIVWDEGEFHRVPRSRGPDPGSVRAGTDLGHLSVVLDGHKLRGGFALTRTGLRPRENWILLKRKDRYADPALDVVAARPESVVSGKTIDQLR